MIKVATVIIASISVLASLVNSAQDFPGGIQSSFDSYSVQLPRTPHYTAHSPIVINSDANFTAANGVTGGSGTPSDPYVLSGWDINASGAIGISISHVSLSFKISSCNVHDGGGSFTGIYLGALTGGEISNCTSIRNFNGIELWGVSLCKIVDNDLSYNAWHGITGATISQNLISRSTMSNNGRYGIDIRCSAGWNTVSHNEVFDNDDYGIYHARSPHSITDHNNIHNNGGLGYFMDHAANSTVTFNNIYDNQGGLRLVTGNDKIWKANDNIISWNNITSNEGDGVAMQDCINNSLLYNNVSYNTGYAVNITSLSNDSRYYGNTFLANNGAGIAYDTAHIQAQDNGKRNLWDLSGEGNFWSDWTGPDTNLDGIVDVPYLLGGSSSSKDHFPVAAPVEPPPILDHIDLIIPIKGPYKIGQYVPFYLSAWADSNESENITADVNITWDFIGGVGTASPVDGPATTFTALNAGIGLVNVSCEFNGKKIFEETSFTVKANDTNQPPINNDNKTGWDFVVVLIVTGVILSIVVVIAAAVILRKRKRKPKESA